MFVVSVFELFLYSINPFSFYFPQFPLLSLLPSLCEIMNLLLLVCMKGFALACQRWLWLLQIYALIIKS